MARSVLAAAGAAALAIASSAGAQPVGATPDAAMQPGGWGPGGWQPGAAPRGRPDAPPPGMAPYRPMPPSGDYRPVHPGQKLGAKWSDPALVVRDWREWGLGRPGPGMRWIRYYDDAVLVDPDGRVVAAQDGIDWDVPHTRTGPGGSYAAGGPPGYAPRGPGYAPRGPGYPPRGPGYPGPWHGPRPGTTVLHPDADTTVTTQVIAPPPPADYGYGGYGYGYGGGTIVSVTPTIVTTTTVTRSERVYSRGVSAWRRATPPGKLVRR